MTLRKGLQYAAGDRPFPVKSASVPHFNAVPAIRSMLREHSSGADSAQ